MSYSVLMHNFRVFPTGQVKKDQQNSLGPFAEESFSCQVFYVLCIFFTLTMNELTVYFLFSYLISLLWS